MTCLPDFLIFMVYYDFYGTPEDKVSHQIISLLITLYMLTIGPGASLPSFKMPKMSFRIDLSNLIKFTPKIIEAPKLRKSVSKTRIHYGKPEEMMDFHNLFPEGTDSSLSRNLTEEIWDEYKDQIDAEGVSFKTCIFSGVKNLDSGIGVYAGSHDSYNCFEKLFDKVIADYHGHSTNA